jgi:nicotinate-nucleotide pyrophosphorylase (carboxylating)
VRSVPFAPLDPALYREAVRRALAEDLGWGDVTTEATVDPALRARGVILAKSDCVIAGLDVAAEAFRQLDPGVFFKQHFKDGDRCAAGTTVAEVHGSAAAMLTAERTALNFLQRLSGIASITRRYVDAAGGGITVLDTRKTTPTLRALEKYAVRAGGGTNHRGGLDDGILIKDNHIRLGGGVAEVMRKMKAAHQEMPIEIEAQSLEQVDEALAAGADTILLDNLSLQETTEAVRRIGGRAKVEVSGGVTLERIAELARTGADYVSIGALTHSAPAADLSFELELEAASRKASPSGGAAATGDLSAGASAKADV